MTMFGGQSGHIDDVLEGWSLKPNQGDLVFCHEDPPVTGQTAPFPGWLDSRVSGALSAMGIALPYTHQVASWELLFGGQSVVIATPTASGKTLCYNVPVMQRLVERPVARALYLFPTKALARDQEASVRKLVSLCGIDAKAVVYDGDTPSCQRRIARETGSLIISNPDMLHQGILPHHQRWSHFFANLEMVVIDELHQYRGVFGAHVANLLRRLVRICRFYDANPVFACCSATIGNPGELARKVIGRPVTVIDQSGAPRGRRISAIFNPAIVDPVLGTRRSPFKTAAKMAFDLLSREVTTLVFCQTRRGVEMVLRYLRERMERSHLSPDSVRGYRGGYLPTLRREIEVDLRSGRLKGVVATNALELGIDVGELDAVVLTGYPGTIAATHQRSGRAGRRGADALSVMVARIDAVDQFLARNPHYLVETSPEQALVEPDNVEILLAHLGCAAFELPLVAGEPFGNLSVEELSEAVACLQADGAVRLTGDRAYYVGSDYPAANVSLRAHRGQHVVVFDEQAGVPIAEVSPYSARFEVHPQAIYQHDGQTYEVLRFDEENAKAFVRPVSPVYYTTAVDQTRIEQVTTERVEPLLDNHLFLGEVSVVEHLVGFKKIKFGSHENLGYGDISLPPWSFSPRTMFFHLGEATSASFTPDGLMNGLSGLANGFLQMAAFRLMCDVRDVGIKVQRGPGFDYKGSDFMGPVLYFYDKVDGGAGLADRAFELFWAIMSDTRTLIAGCGCENGCPGCVGPATSDGGGGKGLALQILERLLPGGESGAKAQ